MSGIAIDRDHNRPLARRDNSRHLASALSTVQADKPCSISHVMGQLVLKGSCCKVKHYLLQVFNSCIFHINMNFSANFGAQNSEFGIQNSELRSSMEMKIEPLGHYRNETFNNPNETRTTIEIV